MGHVLELAKQLVERPSLTPDDSGCQKLIAERLSKLSFTIEHMRFGDVDNLWARHGTSPPLLAFAGHTDVVPTGPATGWLSNPFSPVERDGYLYGRGTADMKGALAAMVVAVERFLDNNPGHPGSIAFLVTSDEEGPSIDGTARVMETLDARGEKIDWCLLGEPSCTERFGDTIRNGRRGSLSGTLTVRGRQGHVAYPERGDNPIHKALPALNELSSIAWGEGDDHLPPVGFQISNFNSGTGAGNVIPGEAVIRFNFRYPPSIDPDRIKQRVRAILEEHGLVYDLDWHSSGQPFLTPMSDFVRTVQDTVESVTGVRPQLDTGGGTSDGRFIAPSGAEVVEFGLLNGTIHMVDERVSIEDLEQLAEVYLRVLQKLVGGS